MIYVSIATYDNYVKVIPTPLFYLLFGSRQKAHDVIVTEDIHELIVNKLIAEGRGKREEGRGKREEPGKREWQVVNR